MRVAVYARYSSDLQREASIEDQVRICRTRAERPGPSDDGRAGLGRRDQHRLRGRRRTDLPPGQEKFVAINAELAKTWPVIAVKKDPLPEAEKWNGVTDKLQYLKKQP